MTKFTVEETNLICIYDPGNRAGTIAELQNMTQYLMPDESELKVLAEGVIRKLEAMTDEDYDILSEELTPDQFSAFDGEDAAFGCMLCSYYDDDYDEDEIE